MENNGEKKLYDINKLKKLDIAFIFDITEKTVFNWIKYGCPRNEDDSFDLKDVLKWYYERLEEKKEDVAKLDLDKKKLTKQIRKLELEIADKEKKTIPREKFEEIQRNQATELMDYVKGGYKRNSLTMMAKLGISPERLLEFNEVMDGFMKAMFDAFIEGGKDID
jgi:phage terminase Nu1 subunit (DNA packaging protein)